MTPEEIRSLMAYYEGSLDRVEAMISHAAPSMAATHIAGLSAYRIRLKIQAEHEKQVIKMCHELLAHQAVARA